jgi:hypothetical protein
VGQAIVFRGLSSSIAVRRRQTTIVCATKGDTRMAGRVRHAFRGAIMRFVILALAASVAFAQTNQVFQLTQKDNQQQLEEIATVLRGTTDIRQVSVDELKGSVAVEGTAAQIAMADWLVHRMDHSPACTSTGRRAAAMMWCVYFMSTTLHGHSNYRRS